MATDRPIARLCVFCGTNAGSRAEYGAAARELGTLLAEEGIELVYGGASVGIMGELADAVQEGGGHVTGIIPQQLIQKEAAHRGIQDLIVVASMHQRKSQMADLSDGFIALPGGIGTLEGFFEILTWGQLGIHAKPCGILNIAGYFDALTTFLDHAVEEDFLTEAHRGTIMVESSPQALLERMRAYEPPEGAPLMGRANR
ncbi:MAG: TIGR00730 family Rossman fold protein [Gemmatimonadota bacterium]|nr:TIGR00730 family Rossman fold protein [Gemmatimonadota bacterium]